jgi:hypothetical protein
MSYAVIISAPSVIPYAKQIEAKTRAGAIKTMEKLQDENWADCMLMLVDYANASIYRVIPTESGFQLADNADKLIGVNTMPSDMAQVSTQEIIQ